MIWGRPIRYHPSLESHTYVWGLLPECKLLLSDFVGTHSIYGLTAVELRWHIKRKYFKWRESGIYF